jgi:hypothetical protein
MENQFYYKQNGKYYGPCALTLIEQGFEQKQLRPTDLVLDSSNGFWYPVGHYLGKPSPARNPLMTPPVPEVRSENTPMVPADISEPRGHQSDSEDNPPVSEEVTERNPTLYVAGLLLFIFGVADFLLGNLMDIDLTGVSWSPLVGFALGGYLLQKSTT